MTYMLDDEVVNTLHYNGEAGALASNRELSMQALADRLRDDLMIPYRALFNSLWQIEPIVVAQERDPLNPNVPRVEVASGAAAAGTRAAAGDLTPQALCAIATEHTGFVGRRFKGRLFISGTMNESDLTGDSWNAPAAGNFQQLATTFINAIPLEPDLVFGPSTATVNLAVYSRTQRAQDQDPYAPDVTSIALARQVRWLRSRQPGT